MKIAGHWKRFAFFATIVIPPGDECCHEIVILTRQESKLMPSNYSFDTILIDSSGQRTLYQNCPFNINFVCDTQDGNPAADKQKCHLCVSEFKLIIVILNPLIKTVI